MTPVQFGTDQVLLYDVEPWNGLGFGVPNFADKLHTVNQAVWRLVDEIGTLQLYVMTHVDAARTMPPSRNTIERVCRSVNRVQSLLVGRQKEYSDLRVEEGHNSPAQRSWMLHPVPFFNSEIVKNAWLSEYNNLTMFALSNCMQHTDNDLALTMTSKFAGDIWQYFREIKFLVGSELLGLTRDTLTPDAFVFGEEHYAAYAPDRLTVSIEAIDEPVDPRYRFTEQDLRSLRKGIPSTAIVANLSRYPVGSAGFGGAKNEPADTELPGGDGGDLSFQI